MRSLRTIRTANVLDGLASVWGTERGVFIEGNPLLRPLLESSPATFLLVKFALVALACSLLARLWRFLGARIAARGLAAGMVCVAASHGLWLAGVVG
jgi:hypothetical protein